VPATRLIATIIERTRCDVEVLMSRA
jgi:hypothetical protein